MNWVIRLVLTYWAPTSLKTLLDAGQELIANDFKTCLTAHLDVWAKPVKLPSLQIDHVFPNQSLVFSQLFWISEILRYFTLIFRLQQFNKYCTYSSSIFTFFLPLPFSLL